MADYVTRSRMDKKFGATAVESIAATLYNAFHGHCECASHPFRHDDFGDFHGELPWTPFDGEEGDNVVEAFREAAIAAYNTLKSSGIGHLR